MGVCEERREGSEMNIEKLPKFMEAKALLESLAACEHSATPSWAEANMKIFLDLFGGLPELSFYHWVMGGLATKPVVKVALDLSQDPGKTVIKQLFFSPGMTVEEAEKNAEAMNKIVIMDWDYFFTRLNHVLIHDSVFYFPYDEKLQTPLMTEIKKICPSMGWLDGKSR